MPRRLPLLFALLKLLSGLALAGYGVYELHRDEYLYLDYGHHLAWGYLEVPPLTALQSWVTLALGGGFFWVKLWPLLWGSLTIYLVVRLAARLGAGPWAQALAGLCYLCSAYARLNLLFQPNALEVLCFTAGTYLLVRHAQTGGQPRYLYWLGLALGLGVLNKFTTFSYGAAVVGALLVTAPRTLWRPAAWGAAGLALLVASPTLLWQLAHGLPFRHHMALLHDSQLVHVSAAGFWKAQLLLCAAALPVWVPGLVAALRGRPERAARVAGWTWVLGLGLLTVLHGKDYYALGYYPPLFAVGAAWWHAQLGGAGVRAGRAALLLWPLLVLAPLAGLVFPVLPPATVARLCREGFYRNVGFNRWEDGRTHPLPQDFADMQGWHELADKVYAAYQSLPDSTRARTLILCDNYGQAGAINYYNRGRNLPAATSYNGSYLHWFPTRPAQPWRHVLNVSEDAPTELAPHFSSWQQVGVITNPYARERGTAVYLGTGPSPAIIARAEAERAAELAQWEPHD